MRAAGSSTAAQRGPEVHYTAESEFGPYWSVTRYQDIMGRGDQPPGVFLRRPDLDQDDFALPMFIDMDPPKHDAQRKVISPIVSPHSLRSSAEAAGKILDELPIGETFDSRCRSN